MGNYKKPEQEIRLHKLCREARESYLEEESRLPDFAEFLAKYLYQNGVRIFNKKYQKQLARKMAKESVKIGIRSVVFCKDCTVPHNTWTGCPKLGGLVPPDDFYCAFGESRAPK